MSRLSLLSYLTFILAISVVVWSSSLQVCGGRSGKAHHSIGQASPSEFAEFSTFNVLDYGAKGDGRNDDTKAFDAAWAVACKVEASTLVVPSGYRFLVGPISFSGPNCKPNIVFQLDGTIIAPTSWIVWGFGKLWWIEFTKLIGITIQGEGSIDGNGSAWWQDTPFHTETQLETTPDPVTSKFSWRLPSIKPAAVRFYDSSNVTVTGITIHNSPECHLKFDTCVGVTVHDMNISSPGNSPNTDGIHLQDSQDINIHHTNVASGDDCVSIQTGCSNVYIYNMNCGPGHGISIGGLGKDNTKACVSNVTVKDTVIQNAMTGVRIKTWQGGWGSVENVLFSNIMVSEVEVPIMIDQFYCDKTYCKNESRAVGISGVTYEGIKGTYSVKPVHLACSDSLPCIDVILTSIQLEPVEQQYQLYDPFCWEVFGELNSPTLPPIGCLQIRKPLKNHIQSEIDTC